MNSENSGLGWRGWMLLLPRSMRRKLAERYRRKGRQYIVLAELILPEARDE